MRYKNNIFLLEDYKMLQSISEITNSVMNVKYTLHTN